MPQGVGNLRAESAVATVKIAQREKYFPPPAASDRIADDVDKLADGYGIRQRRTGGCAALRRSSLPTFLDPIRLAGW
jgi:hypothetical protein